MKQLFFIFLLFSLCCPAQNDLSLYPGKIPPGAKGIVLPKTKTSDFSGRDILVTTDSAYRALFHDSVHHRLPAIDFSRDELHSVTSCIQCVTTCGNHPQCHRNACRYTRNWYLLDKKARQKINTDTIVVTYCSGRNENGVVNDTAYAALLQQCPELKLFSPDFDSSTVVMRTRSADGCATFTHAFFLDSAARTVTWRMQLTPGGCRGLDNYSFIAVLPRLPEGYRLVFEEYNVPAKD